MTLLVVDPDLGVGFGEVCLMVSDLSGSGSCHAVIWM